MNCSAVNLVSELVWPDVFWAIARSGLVRNIVPAKTSINLEKHFVFQPFWEVEHIMFFMNAKNATTKILPLLLLFHFISVSYLFRVSKCRFHVSENQDVCLCGVAFMVVPVFGRQPHRFARVSLPCVLRPAFHSPPSHRRAPTCPLPRPRAVNADKRYPRTRSLPHFCSSRNSVNQFVFFNLYYAKPYNGLVRQRYKNILKVTTEYEKKWE